MATKQGKIVLDPIYGIIHLDELAVKIIDTDCFQRLRYIKQLSFADFVYPGATHTRFVHSIGVYHLACEMIKVIDAQNLDDTIKLSEDDKMCIRVAALCHDLGHGPFSHGYEEIFKDIQKCKFKHETISKVLVKQILEDIPEFKGGKKSDCIKLIQDLIEGDFDKYKQHPIKNKQKYMFQIVSNKTSGVDVDKWDYFKRDARACGVPETFQYDRALSVARVVKTENGEYELGFRDEDGFSFYNMFNTRFTMYRKVYYHKVADAVGLMIKDIFQLVNERNNDLQESFNAKNADVESVRIDIFPIKISDKEEELNPASNYLPLYEDGITSDRSVSESLDQGKKHLIVDKYLKLTNDVLRTIFDSKVDQYQDARNLIDRLQKRKLYKLVDVIKVSEKPKQETSKDRNLSDSRATQASESTTTETPQRVEEDSKSKKTETQKRAEEIQAELKKELNNFIIENDVEILVRKFNYGQDDNDPVTKIFFYDKESTKESSSDGTDRGTQNVSEKPKQETSKNRNLSDSRATQASESTTTETPQRVEADSKSKKTETQKRVEEDDNDPVTKSTKESCSDRTDRGTQTEKQMYAADTVVLKGKPLKKESVSFVLPSVFEECDVRVYEKFSTEEGIREKTATSYKNKIKEIKEIVGKIRDKYMNERKE